MSRGILATCTTPLADPLDHHRAGVRGLRGGVRRRAVRPPAATGAVAADPVHAGRQHRARAGRRRHRRPPAGRRRGPGQPDQGHRRRSRPVHEPGPRHPGGHSACRSRGWPRDDADDHPVAAHPAPARGGDGAAGCARRGAAVGARRQPRDAVLERHPHRRRAVDHLCVRGPARHRDRSRTVRRLQHRRPARSLPDRGAGRADLATGRRRHLHPGPVHLRHGLDPGARRPGRSRDRGLGGRRSRGRDRGAGPSECDPPRGLLRVRRHRRAEAERHTGPGPGGQRGPAQGGGRGLHQQPRPGRAGAVVPAGAGRRRTAGRDLELRRCQRLHRSGRLRRHAPHGRAGGRRPAGGRPRRRSRSTSPSAPPG